MKKILLISFFSLSITWISFGQNDSLVNKKGKQILPQKGEFAVGICANPIFNYVGNMLSSSGRNELNMSLLDGNIIFGKYFLSSKSAIRLKSTINKNSITYSNSVTDDNNPLTKVNDEFSKSIIEIQVIPGFEKRRGTSRMQIFYGGELIFGFSKSSDEYTYGNAFSSTNPNPTTTINFESKITNRVMTRVAQNKINNTFLYGVRGFVGLEYFFLPKFSIGSELGLTYVHDNRGKKKNKIEYWDFTGGSVATTTNETNEPIFDQINTDILNGQIYLLFYF